MLPFLKQVFGLLEKSLANAKQKFQNEIQMLNAYTNPLLSRLSQILVGIK